MPWSMRIKTSQRLNNCCATKACMKINIDLYAKKAKERYDKWLSENGSQLQLTAMQQYERLHEQAASIDPAIMLSSMPVEDHAYHFGALIGSDRYNDVN